MSTKSMSEMLDRITAMHFNETFDLIVAIANGGIIPAALLQQRLGIRLELLRISLRDAQQKPMYASPKLLDAINFEYIGKKILLVEDRIKTGASLQLGIQLLQGAESIKTFAVNGVADYSLYNESCFKFPWIIVNE